MCHIRTSSEKGGSEGIRDGEIEERDIRRKMLQEERASRGHLSGDPQVTILTIFQIRRINQKLAVFRVQFHLNFIKSLFWMSIL
jgi:hypothetical protein